MENAASRVHSLSKVNRLLLASESLNTLCQSVPLAAAELGAGSGFHTVNRSVCFHLLQFCVLHYFIVKVNVDL